MPETTEVLVIVPVPDDDLGLIASTDSRVHVVDARGRFDVEMRKTWPPQTVRRYLGARAEMAGSRPERDRLLARAEIVLGGPREEFASRDLHGWDLRAGIGHVWRSDTVFTGTCQVG